jgi:Ca-activated chloride channel family protein
MKPSNTKLSTVVFVIFIIIAIGIVISQIWGGISGTFLTVINPREKVEISILYAPESESYMPALIKEFNQSYERGINPVTGKSLEKDEKRIVVTGKNASSGTTKDEIVNAILNRSGTKSTPTIFAPSVGHWLTLVNKETGREVFKTDNIAATANAPVVMAIWESRLKLLQAKHGKEIGWEELLKVLQSPNGWRDYTSDPNIRKKVYYGHTDPAISSTALSTLIMEYFASAKYQLKNPSIEQLTVKDAQNPAVQNKVKEIEQLIRHYSSRTTEFKQYIAQGPDYLDFVALEENDLIYINQGKTEYRPPEKLVALYPKEGTFIHEHPFGIVTAEWVSQEQESSAKTFTQFVLSEKSQKSIMEQGFRPANTNVALGYPIVTELGVDPEQPKKAINSPSGDVLALIQDGWDLVKKRSDVIILADISGSMEENNKMVNAKIAIESFATNISPSSRIGLTVFNNSLSTQVPLGATETNRAKVIQSLGEIQASGSTALYDSLYAMIEQLEKESDQTTIKAVVVLSDGEDTSSTKYGLSDVVRKLNSLHQDGSSILIIPIAYGSGADTKALESIAKASKTVLQRGETEDIKKLFETISSYF